MEHLTSLPETLLLAVINKTDEHTFVRLRRTNRALFDFVENKSSAIKVRLFGTYELQLANGKIDIYRKKKISMDSWDHSLEIKSTLIGIYPRIITLRRPIGPKILEFIQYYHLETCPIFFHDLETDTIIPILKELRPISIRVSNDKEPYNERLLGLPQIKNAKRVRFDFFLGLQRNTHCMLLQNIHELHIGFTDPIPLLILRCLMTNFCTNKSVLDFLDLYTFLDITPQIALQQILFNIAQNEWRTLSNFSSDDLATIFPFYDESERTPFSVAEIQQQETEGIGILFVSCYRIMFVTKNK